MTVVQEEVYTQSNMCGCLLLALTVPLFLINRLLKSQALRFDNLFQVAPMYIAFIENSIGFFIDISFYVSNWYCPFAHQKHVEEWITNLFQAARLFCGSIAPCCSHLLVSRQDRSEYHFHRNPISPGLCHTILFVKLKNTMHRIPIILQKNVQRINKLFKSILEIKWIF